MERNLPHLFIPADRVTTVEIEYPYCDCKVTEGNWTFSVDEGSIVLIHEICEKPMSEDDLLHFILDEPVRGRITPVKDQCSCELYGSCDCTTFLVLKEGPR